MSNYEITSIYKNIIRKIRYFILFKFLMYILYKKYLLRKRKVKKSISQKNQKKNYLINYLYSKVFLTLKEKNLKSIMEITYGFKCRKTIVKQIKNIK